MPIFYNAHFEQIEKPNHKPVHIRAAGYAFIEQEDSVLLMKPTWSKFFECPGGGIDPGESVIEAVIRECREETGYDVEVSDITPFTATESFYVSPSNGEFYQNYGLFFTAKLLNNIQDKTAIFEYEVDMLKWIPKKDITEDIIHPTHWKALKIILNK
ncbi:MAG: hypothetical protein COV59_00965 [Candidatus Magasanikbacteria bacterium CG11_big_fil_rev_8_21_14_0_20_39_34]|uniref:Nudix hydrolase domain-containing protein n=1 Tax=Candidatus Magasanikbacteria bacterium CG11_big_fil_rev_8_21_14_0_20_39_34 TaxID=1974653 RepID=A0A2H0N687_9BACT|nr:MAG: hypothetical protein COV59_00965 [Candidatus Magasanikbacteria bacterium CG11_big_fil_rev_8_21_14_0_20_39_34]